MSPVEFTNESEPRRFLGFFRMKNEASPDDSVNAPDLANVPGGHEPALAQSGLDPTATGEAPVPAAVVYGQEQGAAAGAPVGAPSTPTGQAQLVGQAPPMLASAPAGPASVVHLSLIHI